MTEVGSIPPAAPAARVLVIDEDHALVDAVGDALGARGLQVTRWSPDAAQAPVDDGDLAEWDVLVADVGAGAGGGLELCARLAADGPDLPVVLTTAAGGLEVAVRALRAGAFDVVRKPFEPNDLALALDRALRRRPAGDAVRARRVARARPVEIEGLVGGCAAMRRVHELVDLAGATDVPVLLRGQRGTGKARVARALHERGPRRAGRLVTVSCAAIPTDLLERELLGLVDDAFTDEHTGPGRLAESAGGTLYLDEIAALEPRLQAVLARARDAGVDARVVCATELDLDTEVARRRFREDLFYRIRVIEIDLPPLRARGDDVLALARHFLLRASAKQPARGVSREAAAKLLAYPWPGNVGELENCIAHASAMARGPEILVDDLPDAVRAYQRPTTDEEMLTLEVVERRHIQRVLAAVGGSKPAAAKVLGLHPSTLYRKLEHTR